MTSKVEIKNIVKNNKSIFYYFCCLIQEAEYNDENPRKKVKQTYANDIFKYDKPLFTNIVYSDKYVNKQINPFETDFKQNKNLFTLPTNPFDEKM